MTGKSNMRVLEEAIEAAGGELQRYPGNILPHHQPPDPGTKHILLTPIQFALGKKRQTNKQSQRNNKGSNVGGPEQFEGIEGIQVAMDGFSHVCLRFIFESFLQQMGAAPPCYRCCSPYMAEFLPQATQVKS